MTVGELCALCRNWFLVKSVRGRFAIRGGSLADVPGAAEGQYVRIIGSAADDGVCRYPGTGLTDGEFDGAVWLMAPPAEFEALAGEIDAWERKARAAMDRLTDGVGGYRSESFGGYEYVRSETASDAPLDWRDERLGFSARLNMWRKI